GAGRKNSKQGEFSSNAEVEFFGQQTAMLSDVQRHNRNVITESQVALKKVLGTSPKLAIDAMKRIKEALTAHSHDAIIEQQRATEAQWTVAVARAAHGSYVVGKEKD